MGNFKIKLLYKRNELLPFAQTVKEKADSDKTALGFLSESVYPEAAINEKLIIAIDPNDNSYIGHLLFGGVFPQGRIFQVFVEPKKRNQGVAAALFEKLFYILNSRHFTHVSARVASDLPNANLLYERMGFKTQRTVKGGKSKNREINLRVRDLDAPTLFTFVPKPLVAEDLNIPERTTARAPTYVVDLNVIFDAIQNRLRSESAGTIMQASFKNYIRVAISKELKTELQRTATDIKSDPMINMVNHFWTLEIPSSVRIKEISSKLAPIVFPERSSQGILTAQDASDLIHLITTIENHAAGFVTSEKKILAASDYFRSEYGLEIISLYELEELVREDENSWQQLKEIDTFSDSLVACRTTNLNDDTVQKAISTLSLESRFIPSKESTPTDNHHYLVVSDKENQPLGFAWWTNYVGPTPKNDAFITADEESIFCEGIVEFLCDKMIRESCARDVCLINLNSDHKQPKIRNLLLEHGFRASSGKHSEEISLQKICAGQPLHQNNWDQMRLKISNVSGGIKLPKNIPGISDRNSLIELIGHDGKPRHVTHQNLEHLLSPTLLISGDRDGVIVPIKRSWADDLFGTHEQGTLLSPPEAITRRERVYFSDPSTQRKMQPGRIILFYESGGERGGRKGIITIARITQSNVILVEEIEDNLLRRGVIDKKLLQSISVSGKQTVTFFDNVMNLENLVSFKELKKLGCDNNLNFVTATSISAIQLTSILIKGQFHV